MATSYGFAGPRIVRNGLVLYLDAANPNSYNLSTPLTWRDISGNRNNGTLVNGTAVVSTTAGNVMSFDGVDDYISTPLNIDANPNTIFVWFNALSVTGARGIILTDNGAWDKGLEINNGVFNIHIGNNLQSTSVNALVNIWYLGTLIYTSNSMSFFVNGVSVWTGGAPAVTSGSSVEIGRAWYSGGAGSRFFIGNIALVQVYNRALSQSEITQNYNATKGRFGL